jgi:hypothetical protein
MHIHIHCWKITIIFMYFNGISRGSSIYFLNYVRIIIIIIIIIIIELIISWCILHKHYPPQTRLVAKLYILPFPFLLCNSLISYICMNKLIIISFGGQGNLNWAYFTPFDFTRLSSNNFFFMLIIISFGGQFFSTMVLHHYPHHPRLY